MNRQLPDRHRFALAVASCALLAALNVAADDEDVLEASWRGSTVVTVVPVGSDCGGFYTDNEVVGGRSVPAGSHRFAAGELAVVHSIDLHRSSVDVLLDLVEPLLAPYQDGPFTLYQELRCKVELEIDLGRRRSLPEIEEQLPPLLERHPTAESARRSPTWNRRRMDPYPPDYEETLAAHAVWKAEEANRAVQLSLEDAIDVADRALDNLRDDPEELAGFAAGVRRGRYACPSSCDLAVGRSVSSFLIPPPRDESRRFKDGFEEGQRLAVAIGLARLLPRCFVPIPPTVR